VNVRILQAALLTFGLASPLFCGDPSSSKSSTPAWNSQSAESYLDGRLAWWSQWKNSARDHETFCVSCHTVAPYAVSRLTVKEKAPSESEAKLIANVMKRVRMWDEVEPYYSDQRGAGKTAESRGTESILNTLVLASYRSSGAGTDADLKLALDRMWATQLTAGDAKGAWNWLQFHNAPWEGDSQFYGASLAALAVGASPAEFRSAAEDNIKSLRDYLRKNYASQKLNDRLILLWASTKLSGLLSSTEQKGIVADALGKQQADGGFSSTDLVSPWTRADKTALETKSDGYATGLVALVLQEAGVSAQDAKLRSALDWLAKNQEASDGRWLAYSLNKQRDLNTDVGRFMADAATAYAASALTRASH
jgi:hypothetical protein